VTWQPSTSPAPAPPLGERARAWLRGALLDNVGLKFVSLVLALTVFILVNTGQDREIVARVGVSYTQLPPDEQLVSDRIEAVRITVRGPWNRIRHFDERELDRIDLDLSHVQGGEVAITPDMIKLPSGLTLTSVTPRFVRVQFERYRDRPVAVEPVFTGEPTHGYTIDEDAFKRDLRGLPPVTAHGAESVVAALTTIRTQAIDLAKHDATFSADVQLRPPDGVTAAPDTLTIEVPIARRTTDHTIESVPVVVAGDADAAKLKLAPAQVEVVLHGDLLELEGILAKGVTVHVDVSAADAARPHAATVVVDDLPPDVTHNVVPAQVMVTPKR
jgi:YbbR domain-containing protein